MTAPPGCPTPQTDAGSTPAAAPPSFARFLEDWPVRRVRTLLYSAAPADVRRALERERRSPRDFAALLSPAAADFLENMARKSYLLTRRRFGNVMQFYVPLYVSNYCRNQCTYCGFNSKNRVARRRLSLDEACREAEWLARQGFRHLLLVSGEDRAGAPVAYFEKLAGALRSRFASLNIEIYSLTESEYARLVRAGIDSITLYQETYDPEVFRRCHPRNGKGPFRHRLDTLEAAARAGMEFLGIGALLGLADWRVDAFYTGLHGRWLTRRFWRHHVSVSFPRMRQAAGAIAPAHPLDDAGLVQVICATRLFLPDAGLVLSTREGPELRDRLAPLGITRMSAGSRTTPGGYAESTRAEEQFEVLDHRPLPEVMAAVRRLGLDPVCKDWDPAYHPAPSAANPAETRSQAIPKSGECAKERRPAL